MLADFAPNSLLEISVKKMPEGLGGSTFLHDEVEDTGTEVEVLEVGGDFVLDPLKPLPPKLLLLSAGIGITPFVSMIRGLEDAMKKGRAPLDSGADIQMLHCTRGMETMPFQNELKRVETTSQSWSNGTRFQLRVTDTGPAGGKGDIVPEFHGRISKEMLMSAVPDLAERDVYVCGPDGFMREIYPLLQSMGVDQARISSES